MVLDAEPDLTVIAEAADVDAAVRKTRGHRPSVLVLDLTTSGRQSSLNALPRLAAASPQTRVVLMTMRADPDYARQVLLAGASAFVLKEAGADELINAVRTAAKGGLYVNPRIGALLATTASGDPYGGLTGRELDVLRRLALGHTNGEIGEQLYLSTRTVESHRAHIQQKLRLTSRSDLVRWVLDHGLLDET